MKGRRMGGGRGGWDSAVLCNSPIPSKNLFLGGRLFDRGMSNSGVGDAGI